MTDCRKRSWFSPILFESHRFDYLKKNNSFNIYRLQIALLREMRTIDGGASVTGSNFAGSNESKLVKSYTNFVGRVKCWYRGARHLFIVFNCALCRFCLNSKNSWNHLTQKQLLPNEAFVRDCRNYNSHRNRNSCVCFWLQRERAHRRDNNDQPF